MLVLLTISTLFLIMYLLCVSFNNFSFNLAKSFSTSKPSLPLISNLKWS